MQYSRSCGYSELEEESKGGIQYSKKSFGSTRMTSQVHEVRCLAVHSPAKDPPTMTTLGRLVDTMVFTIGKSREKP